MLIHTLSFLLLTLGGCLLAFPENVKRCKFDDNECQVTAANEIFHKYFGGLDQLGLLSVDPLKLDKLNIAQGGNESVQIDLKMRHAKLLGLSNAKMYKIMGFQKDPERNKLEFNFKTPLGTLTGPYNINGRMLILPITGKGDLTMKLENLDIHLKFLTRKVQRGDKIYMDIVKEKMTFNVTKATVNFTNLFNGDKALGDNMNLFLNQNWQLVLDELKKPISASFSKIFKESLNLVFNKIPYNQLFIE